MENHFWVFGMNRPQIEPWSSGPLVNTLLTKPVCFYVSMNQSINRICHQKTIRIYLALNNPFNMPLKKTTNYRCSLRRWSLTSFKDAKFGYHSILTIVGYLIQNPFLYIWTALFQTIHFRTSTQFTSIWPIDRTFQVPPLRVRVEWRDIAMKGYFS